MELRAFIVMMAFLQPCYGRENGNGRESGVDVKLRKVSPSKLLVPSFVLENRRKPVHVFDYAGQELVDTSYKEPWLHLIESSLKPKEEVVMDKDFFISFNYTVICTDQIRVFEVKFSSTDKSIIRVLDYDKVIIKCENSTVDSVYDIAPSEMPSTKSVTETTETLQSDTEYRYVDDTIILHLESGVLGRTHIEFTLQEIGANLTDDPDYETHYETVKYPVSVLRKVRPVDVLFRVIIYCMQIFVMTAFGIKLDIQVVKDHLFKPVAPILGLCCQYIVMPLIAFGVAKGVHIDNTIVSLGIFIAGCCPGGGGSNMYSYLLKGNLSLSITMTAISTVAALGMLPLWVYTLGYTFLDDPDLKIPFSMVAVSLSILITPLVFGIFLRQKLPKVAKKIQKLLKPIILIMSLLLIVLGVYSNMFLFRLFKPRTVLAACMLPYIGYLSGGILALIFQQPWKTVKTISIETGMQNTSIAYILMTTSFPAPDGDIGSVAPLASAVMTPIPLFLITLVYLLYQRLRKKYAPVEQEEASDEKKPDENHDTEANNEQSTPIK